MQRFWSRREWLLAFALLVLGSAGTVWDLARVVSLGMFDGRSTYPLAWVLALCFSSVTVVGLVGWFLVGPSGPRLSKRQMYLVLVLLVLGLIVVRYLVPTKYDVWNDRDEALEIAVSQLLGGQDPWSVTTQNPGNYPSPMFGGILLALPFALLGNSALQMVAAAGVGFWLFARHSGLASATALALLVASAPIFLSEWMFEHDIAFNAAVLAIAMGWALTMARREQPAILSVVGSAALFALGITDRITFALLGIVVAIALWRIRPGIAITWSVVTVVLAGLLILVPLQLFPSSWDRLSGNAEKMDSIPYLGLMMVATMSAIAVVGALFARQQWHVFAVAAAVSTTLPLSMILGESVAAGSLSIDGYLARTFTGPFVLFGLLALLWRTDLPLSLHPRSGTTAEAPGEQPFTEKWEKASQPSVS